MQIVLATRNQHKQQELVALLRDLSVVIKTLDDFPDAPDVIEDGVLGESSPPVSGSAVSPSELTAQGDSPGTCPPVASTIPVATSTSFLLDVGHARQVDTDFF